MSNQRIYATCSLWVLHKVMRKAAFWAWIAAVSIACRWSHWHGSRPDAASWHVLAHFGLSLAPLPKNVPCSVEWEPYTQQPVLLVRGESPLFVPQLAETGAKSGNTFLQVQVRGYDALGVPKLRNYMNEFASCIFLSLRQEWPGYVQSVPEFGHFPSHCPSKTSTSFQQNGQHEFAYRDR